MLEDWNSGNREAWLCRTSDLSKGLEGEAVTNRPWRQSFARLAKVSPSRNRFPTFQYSIIPIKQ